MRDIIKKSRKLLFDIVSPSQLISSYSTECLKVENLNQPALRVRRDIDNLETEMFYNNDGRIDPGTLLDFLQGGEGYVSVLYDNTNGMYRMLQDTLGDQPRIGVLDGQVQIFYRADTSFLQSEELGDYQIDFASGREMTMIVALKKIVNEGYTADIYSRRGTTTGAFNDWSINLSGTNNNWRFVTGSTTSSVAYPLFAQSLSTDWHVMAGNMLIRANDYVKRAYYDGERRQNRLSVVKGTNSIRHPIIGHMSLTGGEANEHIIDFCLFFRRRLFEREIQIISQYIINRKNGVV